ncbi:MAG TPA: hypothetical protein VHV77_15525, partial [Pirellulales bacterium]|nr:hypothetical protein [Pirellulales bacterium]
WNEDKEDRKTASQIKRRLLNDSDNASPKFVDCPRKFLDDLKDGKLDLRHATADEIDTKIAEYASKPYRDKALDAIVRVLESQNISGPVRDKIRNVLKSDSEFVNAVRQGTP